MIGRPDKKLFFAAILATTMLSLSAFKHAQARVTGFEVIDIMDPAFDGQQFADIGQYRRIKAKVSFAVDPDSTHNNNIVDIDKATRNSQGEVEFSTDIIVLQPAKTERANKKLFFEISNRGRNLSFAVLNDSPYSPDPKSAEDAGNGYLLNEGYTIVWSGWQPDLTPERLSLSIPVAEGVTGLSREEFIFDSDEKVVKAALTYPAADMTPDKATLTARVNERDQREAPDGLSFTYLSETEIEITRPENLPAGAIYEFIYPATQSKVTGLGFAATRDLISFLRGSAGHDVEPPLANIKQVLGIGISQAGRFARDFVYQGFNADENNNVVFDGLIAHIAGSRKTFTNYRFAQPGRYSRQHEDHAFPGDQFPFTYAVTQDPLTGKEDGILGSCTRTDTCPKIMHTDTDTEFWQARASLVATDPAGTVVPIPENVRLYYLAGTQHFTIAGGDIGRSEQCAFDNNVFHIGAVMRGLTTALDAWVRQNQKPPNTRFPNRVGSTLVKPEDLPMAGIPGLTYQANINRLHVLDHSQQPPQIGAEYPVFVAMTDTGGNVINGIQLPRIAAPLGTHTGWNLRKEGYAEGELCSLSGSYIPFAKNSASAQESDHRPAIEDLYQDKSSYMAQIEASLNDLLGQRFILPLDVDMLRERAEAHWQRSMINE